MANNMRRKSPSELLKSVRWACKKRLGSLRSHQGDFGDIIPNAPIWFGTCEGDVIGTICFRLEILEGGLIGLARMASNKGSLLYQTSGRFRRNDLQFTGQPVSEFAAGAFSHEIGHLVARVHEPSGDLFVTGSLFSANVMIGEWSTEVGWRGTFEVYGHTDVRSGQEART